MLHFDCLVLILVHPLSAAQLSNQVKREKRKDEKYWEEALKGRDSRKGVQPLTDKVKSEE